MSLTYVSTKMIEQPVQFETLSAGNFTSIKSNLTSVNINLAQVNNLQVTSATATNLYTTNLYVTNLTADYFVQTTNTSIIFTSQDNSKAYHFNTTGGPLSAIFPKSLPLGFNVSIYNIGGNPISLSSDTTINTPGFSKINSTNYTGMFIYKALDPNGTQQVFYGVGIFE